MISDALGMPLAFCITGGESADCSQAIRLLESFKYEYALMDKAYDSNDIVSHIEATGAVAVIPSRVHRKNPRDYDKSIYKARSAIECTFGWLKYFRRIFSRFDKLKQRFCDYFAFAASVYRLRYLNNS